MKVIGLDIGTTTISGAVVDTDSRQALAVRTVPGGSFIKTASKWERIQDAGQITGTAKAVLDELTGLYPDAQAIGLTGQMHGIVYVDQKGESVSPLYTWQDGRGNLPGADGKSLVDHLKEKGLRASSGYGLVTHLYNCQKGLVPDGSVSLCTIADYFGMKLTGRRTPLVHVSNGASLGCFDCGAGDFKRDELRDLGLDLRLLPEVSWELCKLGTYQGIPVMTAIGDNQASFLGSVGMKEDTALVNMGTGGQISLLSDQYFEAPGIEARPIKRGKYLLAGSSLCGGRAYAVLERFFRNYVSAAGGEETSQYDVMARLAERMTADEDGMKVTTTFCGTRVDPGERGNIRNISEDNFTPEGLIAGVLTGMAQELYDLYDVIRKGTGIKAGHLVASGNGLRKNPALQRIFCRMFEADLTLAPYEEEAACGAAKAQEQLAIPL